MKKYRRVIPKGIPDARKTGQEGGKAMRIEGINNRNGGMPAQMPQSTDATGKNIQSQIKRLEQELQKLSENENMSMEEKMKKRQEIQQEISTLNIQLRQHQIAQRRDPNQNKLSSMDDMIGGQPKVRGKAKNGQGASLSQASMKAMISAGSSMKQAEASGSVAVSMEDRAGVLKAEMKQDGGKGENTAKAKQEELANVEQAAMKAEASQMNALGNANKAMKEAGAAEQESRKAAGQKDEKVTEDDRAEGAEKVSGNQTDKNSGEALELAESGQSADMQTAEKHTSVDIRL